MRGFALSDSLMALAIVSLLFVVMLSRGPDLEAREAERRTEAFMFDAATAALTLSQTLDQTGSWTLYDHGEVVALPIKQFQYFHKLLTLKPAMPYRLELQVTPSSSGQFSSAVQLYREDDLLLGEEVTWSSSKAS